jgi:hypothetical protein
MDYITAAQEHYIRELCVNLGYDADDYLKYPPMSKQQASKLIAELKDEMEG